MTRAQRIYKLGHAVELYKGQYDSKTLKALNGKSPKPWLRKKILEHLHALGIKDIGKSLFEIEQIKNMDSFRDWMKTIK
jgi:hypothetical protein